jgi:hypothetical protein
MVIDLQLKGSNTRLVDRKRQTMLIYIKDLKVNCKGFELS